MKTVNERVSDLKLWLAQNDYDAIIVPSNDPHFSGRVADHWKCREFISGFTGGMCTAVITSGQMALWTDSRYYLQAENQLKGTEYQLQRIPLPETPSVEEWLVKTLSNGRVAIDGKLFSVNEFQRLEKALGKLELSICEDPFKEIWTNRPALPDSPAFLHEIKYSGESVQSKIARLKAKLGVQAAGAYVMTALDDIAWLLNLRGNDVVHTPLNIAYSVLDAQTVHLFMGKGKLNENDARTLSQAGVVLYDYSDFEDFLMTLKSKTIIFNGNRFSIYHYNLLKQADQQTEQAGAVMIPETISAGAVTHLKGIKNKTEIEGFHRAMLADGIALTRFNIWLEQLLDSGKTTTEMEIAERLYYERSLFEGFKGFSFSAIVGYRANGAMPHYTPSPDNPVTVEKNGFLLMDTGGQYLYGTTDITRTIHLSEPTSQEKTDYTLSLMGMIDLSMIVWPEGIQSLSLDILARAPMLSHKINYLHGTGHGIGHFLNVHEGPHTVRMNANVVHLEAGMTLSNEPAIYRTGQYGIRNENIMIVRNDETNEFGRFLRFETLTMCYIDTKSIDKTLMSARQIEWLNDYNETVYTRLSPHLFDEEVKWLRHKTQSI